MQQKPVQYIKSVIFVSSTPGSVLARRVRQNEEKLCALTGSREVWGSPALTESKKSKPEDDEEQNPKYMSFQVRYLTTVFS